MQTLNIFDKKLSELNAFAVLNTKEEAEFTPGKQLLEQLQTTLEIEKLLYIFTLEVSKYVDFCGLYFQQPGLKFAMQGSKPAKVERKYDVKINGEYIGSLNYALNAPISLTNHQILKNLHSYLAYPLRNAVMYYKAMQLAMEDGLTGLGNRRYFDEQMARAINHANRQQTQVGLILGDLDKFKTINDTYGHKIGDQILIHFAKALKNSVRDSDSVFRFGGDEFAIIVEHACVNSLGSIKSRIVNNLKSDHVLSKYQIACSLGAAFMTRADDMQSLFERADQELYRQKQDRQTTLRVVG